MCMRRPPTRGAERQAAVGGGRTSRDTVAYEKALVEGAGVLAQLKAELDDALHMAYQGPAFEGTPKDWPLYFECDERRDPSTRTCCSSRPAARWAVSAPRTPSCGERPILAVCAAAASRSGGGGGGGGGGSSSSSGSSTSSSPDGGRIATSERRRGQRQRRSHSIRAWHVEEDARTADGGFARGRGMTFTSRRGGARGVDGHALRSTQDPLTRRTRSPRTTSCGVGAPGRGTTRHCAPHHAFPSPIRPYDSTPPMSPRPPPPPARALREQTLFVRVRRSRLWMAPSRQRRTIRPAP